MRKPIQPKRAYGFIKISFKFNFNNIRLLLVATPTAGRNRENAVYGKTAYHGTEIPIPYGINICNPKELLKKTAKLNRYSAVGRDSQPLSPHPVKQPHTKKNSLSE